MALTLQMHTSNGNDWDKVAPADRSYWQKTAAATHGVVTPGNIVSAIGFALVIVGLVVFTKHTHPWRALSLVVLGRLADLLDGIVADKTGTKSKLGEMVDATSDKLVLGFSAIVLLAIHAIPVYLAFVTVLQNAYISMLAQRVLGAGITSMQPNRYGKLTMAFAWTTFFLYTLTGAHLVEWGRGFLEALAYLAFALFCVLGVLSCIEYTRDYRQALRRLQR